MNKKWIIPISAVILAISVTACSSANEINDNAQSTQNQESQESTNISAYYTADEGGSITKIDDNTNQVLQTIKLEGAVHNVQVSPDGKIVGATVVPAMSTMEGMEGMSEDEHGLGDDHVTNGFAYFYDTKTGDLLKKVEVGAHPAHIVFTGDGKSILVTNNEGNNVTVMDAKSYQTTGVIPTGKGPHGFRVSADSQYAYVANMNEDTVSVLNLQTMTEDKKIQVGNTPVTTGLTSDGKTLIVPLNTENMAVVVDLVSGQLVEVPVGEGPAQVYVQTDNKYAIVANQGTEETPSHSISKIDLATKKVVATVETGKGSHGVVTSKDNKKIYVTNMFEDTVSVIDNEKNVVIETIKVGITPNGISITP
jgi:YVTN family beta-propeller protein